MRPAFTFSLITTAGDEMQVASAVVAFQAFRHTGMVVVVRGECCDGPHTRPLRKNRKARGTLRFVYGV
jgi:hypothetical protein